MVVRAATSSMDFRQPKGIYQQVADQMRDRILAGEWQEGERIPSVRELAAAVGVNPNTVTKSYQALLDREVIENRRGIGYFVAADARKRIVEQLREEFVREELPRIFRTMRVLGMQPKDLDAYFVESSAEPKS
jgi:DNA-binding transcriptional regulator YhcF (GntR family)